MTVLFAAAIREQTSFDDSGETQIASSATPLLAPLSATAEKFHGTVIPVSSEELIAEFSEPSLAVRAAAEMQRRLLKIAAGRIRLGIHHNSRDLAARIGKQAKPGQILISRAVREAVLSDVDVRCTWQGQLTGANPAEKEDLFEVDCTEPTV